MPRHIPALCLLLPSALCLNRLLLSGDDISGNSVARLTENDPRTVHVRNVLQLPTGATLRAGVLDGPLSDFAEVRWASNGALDMLFGEIDIYAHTYKCCHARPSSTPQRDL